MFDLTRYSDDVRAMLEAQHAISHCMAGPASREWAELDLTIGQVKALMALSVRGDLTISEVANHLGVGKPAASIMIDRLVHLGFAQRTEDALDRRRTLVTLTDAANALVTRLRQGNLDRLAQWIEAMEPADRAALARGMEALRKIAEPFDSNPHAIVTQAPPSHEHETSRTQ